jgi:hypothetical protein
MRFFGRKQDVEPEQAPQGTGEEQLPNLALRPEVVPAAPLGAYHIPSQITLTNDAGDQVRWVATRSEAKRVIDHLKLEKKEWQLVKKDVGLAMQQIRADYRQATARRSHTHGRGQLASTFRTFEQIGRDSARRKHATRLDPLEDRKANIDATIQFLDRTILELQQYQIGLPDEPKPRKPSAVTACPDCGSMLKRGDRFCAECGLERGPDQ